MAVGSYSTRISQELYEKLYEMAKTNGTTLIEAGNLVLLDLQRLEKENEKLKKENEELKKIKQEYDKMVNDLQEYESSKRKR